ncbi:MAG: DUF262 domain-containing protein [Synergistaceae bacterium]|nr:DUF262 domain-containing protein [Synergistaceae bacterium]
MQITMKEFTIQEISDGFIDSAESGVRAYGGRLDVRPAFQREFIYKDKQRNDVIRSVRKNYPLNVMYWIKKDSDSFEILDGQQRTISICQYVHGNFSVDGLAFHNLAADEQEQILNYKLIIYICEGMPSEIRDWFEIVNIEGVKLTNQEKRNAALTGTWLNDARMRFSKRNCDAYRLAKDYLSGSPERQEYLETAIKWAADKDNTQGRDKIFDYMAQHQHEDNCNDLWLYFQGVINWVKVLFPENDSKMKGIDWGYYYNRYHTKKFDAKKLNSRLHELLDDDEITKLSGIYEYLIDGEEKHLSLRKFTDKIKRAVYERQEGICKICGKHCTIKEMEADHITPWSQGGRTVESNCQLLCKSCNRKKGSK